MIVVKNCCCFQLETGAKILAWLGIISNILGGIRTIPNFFEILNLDCYYLRYYGFEEIENILGSNDCATKKAMLVLLGSSEIIFFLERFVASILLLIAMKTRNSGFVIPLLVSEGICLAVLAVALLVFLIQNIMAFLVLFIIFALSAYFYLVEYSVYVKLRNEVGSNQQAYQAQYIPNA